MWPLIFFYHDAILWDGSEGLGSDLTGGGWCGGNEVTVEGGAGRCEGSAGRQTLARTNELQQHSRWLDTVTGFGSRGGSCGRTCQGMLNYGDIESTVDDSPGFKSYIKSFQTLLCA